MLKDTWAHRDCTDKHVFPEFHSQKKQQKQNRSRPLGVGCFLNGEERRNDITRWNVWLHCSLELMMKGGRGTTGREGICMSLRSSSGCFASPTITADWWHPERTAGDILYVPLQYADHAGWWNSRSNGYLDLDTVCFSAFRLRAKKLQRMWQEKEVQLQYEGIYIHITWPVVGLQHILYVT